MKDRQSKLHQEAVFKLLTDEDFVELAKVAGEHSKKTLSERPAYTYDQYASEEENYLNSEAYHVMMYKDVLLDSWCPHDREFSDIEPANWSEAFKHCGIDLSSYHPADHHKLTQLALQLELQWLKERPKIISKWDAKAFAPEMADILPSIPSPSVGSSSLKPVASNSVPVVSNKPLLSKAFNDWADSKSWEAKILAENERLLELLVAYAGDKFVDEYTRPELRSFIDVALGMPKRNIKPYNKMTITECFTLSQEGDIPERDRIAVKAGSAALKWLQGLFSAYLYSSQDLLDSNIVEGFKAPTSSTRYGDFSRKEVDNLFNYFADSGEWLYPLLIDTGCRKSEVLGLTEADFTKDHETGRLYFVIKSGKTTAAKRVIPISNRLLEAGFVPSLCPIPQKGCNTYAINRLREALVELGIPEKTIHGEKRVIHSFRHTFITLRMNGGGFELHFLQRLVGHAVAGAGVTSRYTHSYTVKDALPVFDYLS